MSTSSTVPAAPGTGVAPNPSAIDLSKLLVRGMKGYLYSPVTKRMYYIHDRSEVGPSTYERPWSVNPGYGFETPVYPLNPVDYPTYNTANDVLAWAREMWPTLQFDVYAPSPEGYVTQLQYWLIAWNGADVYEIYSAGWWAFDLDKDGEAAAYDQRSAELRQAGFSF